jgi:hypothetical protein
VVLDFASTADDLSVTALDARGAPVRWRRSGRDVRLLADGVEAALPGGSELAAMLRHFREVAAGDAAPLATGADAIDVAATARAAIDALAAAGAPFERPGAPRHVASRAL